MFDTQANASYREGQCEAQRRIREGFHPRVIEDEAYTRVKETPHHQRLTRAYYQGMFNAALHTPNPRKA